MADEGDILLTIFLKHDQGKNLGEINVHLDETGFWKEFPPGGIDRPVWEQIKAKSR